MQFTGTINVKLNFRNVLPRRYLLVQVNNGNSKTMCGICSKLTVKTLEGRHWRHSDVFIVNFEQILHIVLLFSTDDFEHVNAGWVTDIYENTSSLGQNEFIADLFPLQLVLAKWNYPNDTKFDVRSGMELNFQLELI